MYRAVLAICLMLAGAAPPVFAGEPQAGNLAGTWKIDQERTTADPDLTTQIVVSQMGDAVRIDYYEGKRLAATEKFIADGQSRERYRTRMNKAYASARWEKGSLVVVTDVALDNEGLQSYSMSERWTVSKDGKTLTRKTGDGKVKVFDRAAEAAGH